MSGTRASWGPAMGDFRADGVGRLLWPSRDGAPTAVAGPRKKNARVGARAVGEWRRRQAGRQRGRNVPDSAPGNVANLDLRVDEIQATAVGQSIRHRIVDR